MVKTVFKIIGVTLLTGYLLAAGWLYGFWRDEPCYRGIKVVVNYPNDDAHFVKESNILQLVNKKPGFKYKGQPYSRVNTLDLERYIEQNNRLVRQASCYHTPDSLLRIDIEQRNPVLRVKSLVAIRDNGGRVFQDFYVDLDGEMMPAQLGSALSLPLATGYVHYKQLPGLRDLALFLRDDAFWSKDITQIYLREDGDVELVPRVGDHTILLGSLDDYQRKLDNVRLFYDKVLPRKGWNAYRVINAKFDGQVVGEKSTPQQ